MSLQGPGTIHGSRFRPFRRSRGGCRPGHFESIRFIAHGLVRSERSWQNIAPLGWCRSRTQEHLSQTGVLAAIKEPLTRTPGVSIEDDLISRLFVELDPDLVGFDDTDRSKPIAPKKDGSRVNGSFLQIVLTRLWTEEVVKGSTQLTLGKLKRLGGANKIASGYFDDVMGIQLRNAVLARNSVATENEICEIRDSAADLFKFLVTVIGSKFAPSSVTVRVARTIVPDSVIDGAQKAKCLRAGNSQPQWACLCAA
jgi:hypothetical protein